MANDPVSRIAWELNKLFFAVRTGVTNPVLATYYRSLAQCVEAGISLQQALASLEQQTGMKPELIRVTNGIRASLSKGDTLHEASVKYPFVFSSLAVGLIQVGEEIGALAQNLTSMAEIHEARYRMNQAIIRRLIYPIALILVAAYVLPLAVIVVDGVGGYFAHVAPRTVFLALLLAIGVFGPPIARGLVGRAWVDRLVLNIPMYGTAQKHMVVARFCRGLGTSVAAGADMGKAYVLATRAMDNAILEARATKAFSGVKQSGLAKGLAPSKLFSGSEIGIIEIGEQTGKIGENLSRMAGDLEQKAENVLHNFGRLLGTALLIIVVVLSMFSIFITFLGIGEKFREVKTPEANQPGIIDLLKGKGRR